MTKNTTLLTTAALFAFCGCSSSTETSSEALWGACVELPDEDRQLQALGRQATGRQAIGRQAIGRQAIGRKGVELHGIGMAGAEGMSGLALRDLSFDEAGEAALDDRIPDESRLLLAYADGVMSARKESADEGSVEELVDALLPLILSDGSTLWARVESVDEHPDEKRLPLYTLVTDQGESLCEDGLGGAFVPGVWDERGDRHDHMMLDGSRVDLTFACSAGVLTKCAAWGYSPWEQGPDAHQACSRMARAEYCADGISYTEDGTLIDMFDTLGVNEAMSDDGLSFEAGWGPDGAVCVNAPRFVELSVSGEMAWPSCWADKPRCEDWDEAQSLGALLGNESAHELRCSSR